MTEKLSVLTVLAGIRSIAMVLRWQDEPHPAIWGQFENVIRASGLLFRLTPPPMPPQSLEGASIPEDFRKVAATLNNQGDKAGEAIWIFRDMAEELKIGALLRQEVGIGQILGYPRCCVAEHDDLIKRDRWKFFEALISQHQPKTVQEFRHLLESNAPVEVKFEGWAAVGETIRRFPFVFHTACQACLKGKSLLTEEINRVHRILAETIDSAFARALEKAAALIPG